MSRFRVSRINKKGARYGYSFPTRKSFGKIHYFKHWRKQLSRKRF